MRKNLHLEHIEDEIFNFGSDGLRSSINFINSLREMLSGSSTRPLNLTRKFDGAPAIFCGIDPDDGKFFVGTKGVFNKEPKVVKEKDDIRKLGYVGSLATRLELCLEHLPKLEIDGVLQGDLMFINQDLQRTLIGGKQYTTFQPNTIVYATDPLNGDIDKIINKAELGIVFHTTYRGNTLPEMSASFGADISRLKQVPEVWVSGAEYRNVSGTATLTAREHTLLYTLMKKTGEKFKKFNTGKLDSFLRFQDNLPTNMKGAGIKTYINSKIRKGKKLSDPKTDAIEYRKYFEDFIYDKVILKLKSENAIANRTKQLDTNLKKIKAFLPTIQSSFEMYNNLVRAKELILDKLNNGPRKLNNTFVRTDAGYKVVNDEGFVAINTEKGNAVKLIDRLEFSYNNFNGIKNWDK